jgi:hypothetical protein
MAKPNVGRSWRTPIKHEYLWSIVGQEAGAIPNLGAQCGIWYDLTAGDAALIPGEMWHKSCSPGILAYHASQCLVPAHVRLHEIQTATYDRLLGNLTSYLPTLGYGAAGPSAWIHPGNGSTVSAHNLSGADADVTDIDGNTAVFVVNDPNAITEWAMRPTFTAEIATRTWLSRCLSTMGCNPGGTCAAHSPTDQISTVREQQQAMPEYRGPLACRADRDEAMGLPSLTSKEWRAKTDKAAKKSAKNCKRSVSIAWWRQEPHQFDDQQLRLLFRSRSRSRSLAASASGWLQATNSVSR